MPYHKKRKTDRPTRGLTDEKTMRSAVNEVIGGRAVNTVAREKGIDRMTLKRYVRKVRLNPSMICKPNYVTTQVFNTAEETNLSDYILQASQLHCGLSTKATRKLAYQYAVAIRPPKRIPESWTKNLSAGKDWLKDFMRRRSELSLRTPEATSMARATAFNRQTVHEFFTNLREVRSRHAYQPQNIYNVDETGVTTVQKPGQVLAAKGARQVGHRAGAERGTLVTVCCCVNAIGNAVPPFFIFPRIRFNDKMLVGCPPGSVGVASPSGWMNAETFLQWMKHFIHHTGCSMDKQVLLILDNHESHVSYECLELARRSGVTMLTLPPHCSHKMQPLDRSVFGPFKRYYNAACDDWVVENPKPMQITDIAALVGRSYPLAFTLSNITAGFAASGIEPLNADVFHDDEFLASSVTDRPQPAAAATETIVAAVPVSQLSENSSAADTAVADQSAVVATASTSTSGYAGMSSLSSDNVAAGSVAMAGQLTSDDIATSSSAAVICQLPADAATTSPAGVASCQPSPVTLEKLRPIPKAGARKSSGGRKRQKTRILTDTPVRAEIRAIQEAKNKSNVTCKRKLNMPAKKVKQPKSKSSVNSKATQPTATSPPQSPSHRTKKLTKRKTTASEVLRRPRPVSERPPPPRKPQWLKTFQQSGIVC